MKRILLLFSAINLYSVTYGQETLQSVTDRGNVATNTITTGSNGIVLIGRYSAQYPTSGAGYFQLRTNKSNENNGGLSIYTNRAGVLHESFKIDENGNVGIGTTTPQSKLHVFGGTATFSGITLGYGTDNAVITTDDNSKPITFQIAGTEYMRVTNSGYIGIGTNSPISALDVSGNLTLRNLMNESAKGAALNFTSYGSDHPGPKIRSELAMAAGSNSMSKLVLSSYWSGYKDEITLVNGRVGYPPY